MATEKQRLTFISYSRADSEFALELAKELRSSGFYIWLDQLDIPTGSRWDDEVEKALLECNIFMVILTPDSIASNNVKDEIGYAIDSNKRILPVLLENAVLPFRLRRFQYVDFTKKSNDDGIEAAKQLLRKLLNEPTLPTSLTPPTLKKQEDTPPTADSAIPSTSPALEEQRAKAIQQARERERLERQDQVLRSNHRKDSGGREQPPVRNVPLLAGAGLFSIVCLLAGWMILRPWILPPDRPATDAPLSETPPTSTFTPTATMEATFTPTATLTPTVTPVTPEVLDQFIVSFFNRIVMDAKRDEAKYKDAWNLLSITFQQENNPKGFEDWRDKTWKPVVKWEKLGSFTVSTVHQITDWRGPGEAPTEGFIYTARVKFTSNKGSWPQDIKYCLVWVESENTWMLHDRNACVP